MISPPRICAIASSPTSASVSTFLGPRSTPRQPSPRHVRDRTGKPLLPPWQRRGHLLVDETRLCHRKQLPHRHREDDQHKEERFAPDAATADRVRPPPFGPRQKTQPGGACQP